MIYSHADTECVDLLTKAGVTKENIGDDNTEFIDVLVRAEKNKEIAEEDDAYFKMDEEKLDFLTEMFKKFIEEDTAAAKKGETSKNSEFFEKKISSQTVQEDKDNFSKFKKIGKEFINNENPTKMIQEEDDKPSTTPNLDKYSQELTRKDVVVKFDPVVGRDDVIDSITEILCKRKKPNVCLVGLPGVGKTAVVERLAQKIVNGDVPTKLLNKRIFSLDLNSLIAGTKFRGEFEGRLKSIIEEVINDNNILIYIDELHNLVGSGSGMPSSSGDGANILKPYLARGEFQCIGSTTSEEFRKVIEKDKALERRFTKITVVEPTDKETVAILKKLKTSYETHHKVVYTKEAIEKAVSWSSRYITDKQQPDKAIDVLDLAGSLVSILGREEDDKIKALKLKREEIISSRNTALKEDNDFEKVSDLTDELKEIDKSINSLSNSSTSSWPTVGEEEIAKSISKISSVPVDKVSQTDIMGLKTMRDVVLKRVIGQNEAIDIVTKSLQRSLLGLGDPNKPMAAILACGPTGVGKTLLCKEIAKNIFGSDKALIKIDCGSLKEKTAVNQLIGSPAGYIGYDDAPLLRKVKDTPRCILLFDEIEKADRSIYDVLLNLLDEGEVKLSNGDTVFFKDCIVVFTSNLGAKDMKTKISIGFKSKNDDTAAVDNKANKDIVKKAVSDHFAPEFINRLSNVVTFNELGIAELNKIFDLELRKLKAIFKKNKIQVTVSKSLKDHAVKECTEGLGARELSRHIEELVVTPLTSQILDTPDKTKFEVSLGEDKKPFVKVL